MMRVLTTLQETYDLHPMGELTRLNPYKVLMACLLSLRTKDEVMIPASERLFSVADNPRAMLTLDKATVEKLIYPVGFYKTKAQTLLDIARELLEKHDGLVPDTMEGLLAFKGVGRKTANLVLGLGFGLPAICVDTHVHRISNRLGYLVSRDPEDTEMQLRKKLPQSAWPVINQVLVLHGQQICKPIGARCDVCPVAALCLKVDVKARKAPSPHPPSPSPAGGEGVSTPHRKLGAVETAAL